jgi:hypothetical protein
MRSNVYGSAPIWFREAPSAFSGGSATYRDVDTSLTNDRQRAQATVLASHMLAGLSGLAFLGLISLLGAVGFGIWQLWS